MPPLDHLNTDFLDSLQRAEVAPESVDVVVNTHVHSDHVGWNTKREGDSWVPTFPNARYLIPEADYRFFHPDNAGARPAARTEDEAARQDGQPNCVRRQHPSRRETDRVVVRRPPDQRLPAAASAPGHTPGSSVLWLDAGQPAVFVGDLTHSPLQLHRPPIRAHSTRTSRPLRSPASGCSPRRSRRRAAVIPAHYALSGPMVGSPSWPAATRSWSTIGFSSPRSDS